MLHSLEMSPSLVHDISTALGHGATKRSSVERSRKLSSDGSATGASTKTNGSYLTNESNINGTLDPIKNLPALTNGASQPDGIAHRENGHLHRESGTGTLTDPSKSTIVDIDSNRLDRKPRKLSVRDDGFFAEIPSQESVAFLGGSTNITLDAGPEGDHLPKQSTSSGIFGRWTAPSTEEGEEQQPTTTTTEEGANVPAKPAEPIMPAEPLSRPHRTSSPPAFQVSTIPNLATPQPGRLQHRNTLEVPTVPRASMSQPRASRETTRTTDEVYASGRFSPTPNTPTRRRGSASLVRRVTRSAHSDVHLDEAPPTDEAEKWAEMIRQKRESKRRRQDFDDDRVVMGTKVDQNHVNYVTAYNMLTGIRFTVSRTNAKLDRDLQEVDFDAKHKFSFDM
jgi:1-phosphatidylinositol-4-phosphate 5-kinase